MQYRTFPATGDSLSVLGFGAMGFAGWFGPVDDDDGIRSLYTALELGDPAARPAAPVRGAGGR
jgi:predicted aldo/keto reductase-like oxidoreductase